MFKKSFKAIMSIVVVFSVIVGLAWLGHNVYLLDSLLGRNKTNTTVVTAPQGSLEVHYLDVGQGDSTYIRYNDYDILIDATTLKDSDDLIKQLKDLNVKDLDLVIATHPHEDHIGGMPKVFKEYDVKSFYMPQSAHTTKTFEKLVRAVTDEGIEMNVIKAGTMLPTPKELHTEVFAPLKTTYEDLNNYSPIIKMQFGDKAFMFTGDAEEDSELEVVKRYDNSLKADVLKLGHHGSSTSSSEEFLNAVKPSIGVISCGQNNKYGHPHKETLEKAKVRNMDLYRTDTDGSITIVTNGSDLNVTVN